MGEQISSIYINGDGNVIGDGNIVVITKQIFTGPYERISDACFDPGPVFDRVDLAHFVGREWLLDEIDNFLRTEPCGYFLLEAEAGLGKTTFLAWLVATRGYLHHFTELAPGSSSSNLGLRNLAAQLARTQGLNPDEVLPDAATRPDYLLSLLRKVAIQRQPGEKIVIVVDGLDQVSSYPGQNVLGLPEILPKGVYFIVSSRPPAHLYVDLATTSRHPCKYTGESTKNREDMRLFLKGASKWAGVARALAESGSTSEQFVTVLAEKCRGLWIYLHFVVHEIDQGKRSPLNLEALPDGLTQYYARYWLTWRDRGDGQWHDLYLPLLTTFGAAQEPATIRCLADWANLNIPVTVLRDVLDKWSSVLLCIDAPGGEARYSFYHATMHDFLNGKADRMSQQIEASFVNQLAQTTVEAHRRIVRRYLDTWGGGEAGLPGLANPQLRDLDEGYGRRHIATHLRQSEGHHGLHALLLEARTTTGGNAWYEMRAATADISGYLADLAMAERTVKEVDAQAIARGEQAPCVADEVHYALCRASVNTIAQSMGAALLVELVRTERMLPAQALAYALRIPQTVRRIDAVVGLAPYLPSQQQREAILALHQLPSRRWQATALARVARFLREPTLRMEAAKEALALLDDLPDATRYGGRHRVELWTELLPLFTGSELADLKKRAVEEACATRDEHLRTWLWSSIVGGMPEREARRLVTELDLLNATRQMVQVDGRVVAMARLGKALGEPIRKQLQDEILGNLESLQFFTEYVDALVKVIPLLDTPHQGRGSERLVRWLEQPDSAWQWPDVVELSRYLPASEGDRVLAMARAATRVIHDERHQARALAALAPYVPHLVAREAEWLLERLTNDEVGILTVLRSQVETGMYNQVLTHIAKYQSIRLRGEVVAAVLPSLPWHNLRNEAINLLYGPSSGKLLRLLFTASPLLSLRVLTVCLMLVPGVWVEFKDWKPVTALVARMAQLRFAKEAVALALASTLMRTQARAEALASLVDYLPHAMWREVLRAAQLFQGTPGKIHVLSSLLPVLPENAQLMATDQMRGLLTEEHRRLADRDVEEYESIRSLPKGKDKAEALLKLASRTSEPARHQILSDVEAMIRMISDDLERIGLLGKLVEQWAELGLVDEALAAAREIPLWTKRAEVLSALAGRFPADKTHDVKQEAWRAALMALRRDGNPAFLGLAARNSDPPDRDQAILTVVGLLRGIVETYSDEPRESLIRRTLALGVPERSATFAVSGSDLDKDDVVTLAGVEAKGWTSDWASTLRSLLPCLDEDLLIQVVTAANAVAAAASADVWQAIWEVIVGDIVLRPRGILYSIWTSTVASISDQTRDFVLEGLRVLAPAVHELGGQSAIEVAFNAVHDVAIWWSESQVHAGSNTEPTDPKRKGL